MSEETGHSVLIQAMVGADDRTLLFSLPYVKEYIPMGIVFKAMGIVDEQEIINYIGLFTDNAKKYLKLILRDAYVVEQEDGFEMFKSQCIKNNPDNTPSDDDIQESWDEMELEEQAEWKKLATQKAALEYIGTYSLHVIKEEERFDYAYQVVHSDLFPHIGVTASIKERLEDIIMVVKSVLEQTPPELSSDIIDRGMIITGGGALLRNIDKLMTKVTGVPAYVAEEIGRAHV